MIEKDLEYYSEPRKEMTVYIPENAIKFLDVGCGRGNFSAHFTALGKETWGIEPETEQAQIASEKMHKVLNNTIEAALEELPDNYFDVIIFNDILEHLSNPWLILKQIRFKLNDKGVIVASIPNVRFVRNLFNLLFRRDWKYTKGGVLDSTHIRFFTKKTIVSMFADNGFKVEVIKGINQTKSLPYQLLFLTVNLLFLFRHTDIIYKQFAVVSRKN